MAKMKKPTNFVITGFLFFALGFLLWLVLEDKYEAVLWRDSLWCISVALSGYAYALSKKEIKT